MTPEQKKRAVDLIDVTKTYRLDAEECAMQMAALLEELINAPEPEPVARVTGYYGGYLSIETVDGRVLPAGTALYTAPPAPSVPDKTSCLSTGGMTVWGDSVSIEKCNNFVHLASQAAGFKDELINTRAELADVARDAERWRMLPAFLEEFEISYLRLEDAIDASIAAEKGGAK